MNIPEAEELMYHPTVENFTFAKLSLIEHPLEYLPAPPDFSKDSLKAGSGQHILRYAPNKQDTVMDLPSYLFFCSPWIIDLSAQPVVLSKVNRIEYSSRFPPS